MNDPEVHLLKEDPYLNGYPSVEFTDFGVVYVYGDSGRYISLSGAEAGALGVLLMGEDLD